MDREDQEDCRAVQSLETGEDFEWCTLAKHGMKNFIEWLELDMCTFGHRPLGVSYLFTDMDHLCHMITQ